MKELRTQPLRHRLRAGIGRYRELWDCLLLCGGGLLFAGGRLMGQALPMAACLVGAQPFGWRSLSAAAGAVTGYLLWHGGAAGAEFAALALLMLAAVTVFQGTRLPVTPWFLPLMAGVVSAVLGLVTLDRSAAALCWWGARSLLAALLTLGLRREEGRTLRWVCAAAGLAGLPLNWGPGLCLGLLLLSWGAEPLLLGAVGVALDLSGGTPCMTVALLTAALLCRPLPERADLSRLALCLTLPCAVLALFGALSWPLLPGAVLSVALGLLLRRHRPLPAAHGDGTEPAGRLQAAARVMDLLRAQLPAADCAPAQSEADSMFDGAAERVCRCCPRFHRCWQHRAALTYRALTGAADRILERGLARAEDLDPEFTAACCHLEGFVTAINQELDGVLYRRRYRSQLAESRRVLGESYACVADYLRSPPRTAPEAVPYRPLIGVSTAGRRGSSGNGDRGCHFPGAPGEYFVLLCDGMGTGEAAADVGAETVHTLRELLSAGMGCSSALRLLNSGYLLRGSGSFATVDLLRLDLCTGAAALYKWGSAPSYLRQGEAVQRLGRPLPPPGLGPGRAFEEHHFTLEPGSLLVLVSDGAGTARTAAEIAAFTGASPRELAALLIADVSDEDDRTAVVIALRT